jgi:putative lipoprotein
MTPTRARAALLAALLAPLLSLGPARAEDDPWFGHDKRLHFEASAALALLGYGGASLVTGDRGHRSGFATAFAIDVGIAKELWDRAGHGDASLRDLTWDVVGAATGLAVATAIDWVVSRASRF